MYMWWANRTKQNIRSIMNQVVNAATIGMEQKYTIDGFF